jgi:hypothetical protein
VVIAGLEPAIHDVAPQIVRLIMDARVEPAHVAFK